MGKNKKLSNSKKGQKEVPPVHSSINEKFSDDPVMHSSGEEIGFRCRDYGDFPTEPCRHGGFFTITKGCANKKEVMSEVKETLMVNLKDRFILIIQPCTMTLTELLAKWSISERKAKRYRSVVDYPTEMSKSVILGIVTAVLNLRETHNYLLNTDNLVLHFEDYAPYSRNVCHRAATEGDNMFQNIKKAGYDVAPKVHVHLVHSKEDENKMDDIEALHNLIFKTIPQVDDGNPSLPPDWLHFHDLFFETPLNYELISCHSCMLSIMKRINFYRALNDLYYKSSDTVHRSLRTLLHKHMAILRTDWLSVVEGDYVLRKIRDGAKNPYVCYRVSSLISFFRNVIEHADEVAKKLSLEDEGRSYSDLRYLEYRLGLLFPDLLAKLHLLTKLHAL